MPAIAMRELLESGVHFGHQTRRWNPRMRPYILTERNHIYIIDLQKTAEKLQIACDFIREQAALGKKVLFVGTKKQAAEVVANEATRAGMYYVNTRWLGGTLTNFVTIQKRIRRLRELEAARDKGDWEILSKKEAAMLDKEFQKLERSLSGLKTINQLPDILFIVDPGKERIAVLEARKLRIPIVAMVDTNCDPDEIDYVIPANDDAIKSIQLIAGKIVSSIMEGRGIDEAHKADDAPEAAAAPAAETVSV